MTQDDYIEQLEQLWELDDFFFRVREGHFDAARAKEVEDFLQSIHLGEETSIDRRLVALLWYMPQFLRWQAERVAENGVDACEYDHFCERVWNAVVEILGAP